MRVWGAFQQRLQLLQPMRAPWMLSLISTMIVALAEMGDKTQLLALVLAARFQNRPIVAGILIATVGNHALVGADGRMDNAMAGVTCCAGCWPVVHRHGAVDAGARQTGRCGHQRAPGWGVLLTTTVAFSWPRWAIKPGGHRHAGCAVPSLCVVVIGTTLGMLLANAPVVWLGLAGAPGAAAAGAWHLGRDFLPCWGLAFAGAGAYDAPAWFLLAGRADLHQLAGAL